MLGGAFSFSFPSAVRHSFGRRRRLAGDSRSIVDGFDGSIAPGHLTAPVWLHVAVDPATAGRVADLFSASGRTLCSFVFRIWSVWTSLNFLCLFIGEQRIILIVHFLVARTTSVPSGTFGTTGLTSAASPKESHKAVLTSAASPKESHKVVSHFLQPRPRSGTMSVVLPCLNEPYAFKTVMSFCNRTPAEVLEEIIVVDDASVPPLVKKLDAVPSHCKLKVLRHNESLGLMIAKQTGGDAASGTYVGFYDCHVAPARNWYKETIDLLAAKERRLVVPMIADLDLDSWDEKVHGALTAKCYINFNADFWWYEDESDFIPVISGGLVATTRKWWQDSGGFDPGMRGWGGENTDPWLFSLWPLGLCITFWFSIVFIRFILCFYRMLYNILGFY